LAAISLADENTILFNTQDTSGTSAAFGSRILHVSHVTEYVLQKLDTITTELNHLIFDQTIFSISLDKFIHDDPRCRYPGYSFLQDNHNSWNSTPTVLEYILGNSTIFDRYGYINPVGEVVWKPSPCHKYIEQIHRIQIELFVLTIFTFGEPGRRTELATHLLNNVPGGSI
jgi:hypothetical protein